MTIDPGRAAGVALLSVCGGVIVGAALLAILAGVLSGADDRSGASAFFGGMLAGAILGGVAGFALYHRWRTRAEAPVDVRELPPGEAARRFRHRLFIRYGGVAASAIGAWGYYAFRGDGVGTAMSFAPFLLVGWIVYFFASRCPACDAMLDGRAVRDRACARCNTSFR